MRRLTNIIAIMIGLAFISQCLAAENQLLKYDANGNPIGSAAYEKDGKVGVGLPDPQAVLHVKADVNSSSVVRVTNVNAGSSAYAAVQFGINGIDLAGAIFQNSTSNNAYGGPGSVNIGSIASYPVSIVTGNTAKVIVLPNGSVGIGTMTPGASLTPATQEAPLHIYSSQDKNTFLMVENPANGLNAAAILRTSADAANLSISSHASGRTVSRYGLTLGGWDEILAWGYSNGLAIGTNVPKPIVFGTNSIARMTIDGNGNVTIGNTGDTNTTTVNGTLTATKVINAVYQDVAEWVPATTKMEPGTVVVLNREHDNEVMPSMQAYDTAVAGVISAQPGIILGVGSDSKAQVATSGRVKVHVDATRGAIAIGDLLVTSDKPGTAMKSQPVDLGGIAIHRPGTVIGKALQQLKTGEGDILVLLSLQ